MTKFRAVTALIVLAALLAGLVPVLSGGLPSPTAVAFEPQVTRTPRPTIIHPTRRPTHTATLTATPTAFRPVAPTHTATRTSTRPPTQPPAASSGGGALPSSALVEGLVGFGQSLPLSCEARSAVDWARFFGVEIGELEFFNRIPRSADPESGFVGSPYGVWGQIPPEPYGVHAAPVAGLLREYGLPAEAVRGMALNTALAEIAAGRPVVVWVTGHVEPGRGVEISINGETRRVARYEHTVILIGYDDNRDTVTFQDGANVYERPIELFLRAWEPLENMGIVYASDNNR